MTNETKTISQKSRMEALAASTASSLAGAEVNWKRTLKRRLQQAPSGEAKAALELAASLSSQDRAWLRAQLG